MKLNINVSVHTTNPELRKRMMHNRFAGEKLKYLWMMAEGGLKLNCQIVLCTGYNDGAELERTLSDFEKMADSITSVAVVPVGITKYRQGLCPMTTFNEKTAGETIDLIAKYQQRFLEKTGSRKVFPSDEFFLIAKRSLPEAEFYEDYPQYENGVGLMRSLEDEFSMALKINDPPETRRKVTIATGTAVFDFISSLARRAEKEWEELEVRVVAIKNRFFGETITVTGLITAGDLIDQLKDVDIGDELLLSSAMVKADEPVFLDDLTVRDVEKALDTKIRLCPNDGYELLDAINGIRQ
jgi:putative radical SAM enzyme (TIGR03279 family)